MRILVVHSRYATGSSSGENRVVEDEVALLRDRGHDVDLWSPEPLEGGAAAKARMASAAVWSRSAVREVQARIRRGRTQVVHAHNLFPSLSPAILRPHDPPVVVTLHNYRLLCLPATFLRDGTRCELCLGRTPLQGVVHRCYRGSVLGSAALATSLTLHRLAHSFERVARYLAVSEFVKSKYVEAGWPAGRIVVKPNFADRAAGREGPGGDFVYVGRLSPEKGLAGLLPIWARCEARLLVIGDGPERAALEAVAPANVRFAGEVPKEQVAEYLRAARALVLPSICYEGAPRTVVEAFAVGVPVIASRRGALPGIVTDGVTGRLAEPGNAPAWEAAVNELSDDRVSVRMGAAAAREWEERYSPRRSAEALEAVYAAVLDRGSAPARGESVTSGDLTRGVTARISD